MSVSKPPMPKKLRLMTPQLPQSPLLVEKKQKESDAEEKVHRTITPPPEKKIPVSKMETKSSETEEEKPRHPKGHKTRDLAEVWKTMDSQTFLRVTDTYILWDVWVQPLAAVQERGPFALATLKQAVFAPHIKSRTTVSKMAADDLLKMLYLADLLQAEMQGVSGLDYGDWLNDKTAACVKKKGAEEGTNHVLLAHFIMTEDRDFTLYPPYLKGKFGIFFRKTCYHSYREEGKKDKLINPTMIKCGATKGKFEYVIEARIFALPDGWFDQQTEEEEIPETQPLL